MRCVTAANSRVRISNREEPEPSDFELLVQVAAAGINAADLLQVAGKYPAPPGVSADVPGLEFSGIVIAVGPRVTRFVVGDRVMCLVPGAGQAEYAVVDERLAMPVPSSLDLVTAAAFPEAYCTAYDALITQAGATRTNRVLVHGANGGVGLAAVRICVLRGAAVTACLRDPRHSGFLASLGADVVHPDDFSNAGPFDVILEVIGGVNLPDDQAALADDGRIVVIGVSAGGAIAQLDLRALMAKRGRIFASTMRSRSLDARATVVATVSEALGPLLSSGDLTVDVHRTFPLGEAGAAYASFATPGKLGKIVLQT